MDLYIWDGNADSSENSGYNLDSKDLTHFVVCMDNPNQKSFSWRYLKIHHQFNVDRQYSFYVVRVSGVRPILMTPSYQGMGALDVVQIIMNHFR
jgi:hypothetical protein